MKLSHLLLCITCLILNMGPVLGSGIHSFTGVWANQNAELSRIEISTSETDVYVQGWSICGDSLCDWGRVNAETYDRVAQGHAQTTLSATFSKDDRQILLVLSTDGQDMEAKIVSLSTFGEETEHSIFHYHKEPVIVEEVITPAPAGEMEASTGETIPIPVPTGMIYGEAQGMAKTTSSIFHLSLYGPDNPNQVQSVQQFGPDRSYAFSDLPDGRYWLIVDSKGMTGIEAYPAYQEIVIENGKAHIQNVELK